MSWALDIHYGTTMTPLLLAIIPLKLCIYERIKFSEAM